MRILLVGINFYPELTGIGKYSGEFAAYLADQGHEVRVVTAPPYYPWWRVQAPYRWWRYVRERWKAIDIWRVPVWVPRRVSGLKRLVHLASFSFFSVPVVLSQVFWRPDVVLVIAPALSAAPVAWLAARLSGAKAWLHLQDFEVDAALSLGILPPNGLIGRVLRSFERRLLRSFDVVSTISGRMCERLYKKGVSQERVVFFPNWVDTEAIRPLDKPLEVLRREFRVPTGREVVVLYSGSMGEKQGLEVLIEAARQLRNQEIRFVLCGEGPMRERLQEQAAQLQNVTFLPLQPLEKLNALLNMADIHVLPQRSDAADLVMPSKLTNMLASGRPVVATAYPQTEVGRVVGQVGVLVPPDKPHDLAQAILDLATNPERRYELGKKGRRFVIDNWERHRVLGRVHEKLLKIAKLKRAFSSDRGDKEE